MARGLRDHHFVRSIRTSTSNNTAAYGFSLAVAGSFAALTKVHGDPTWLQLFLFLLGSSLGFALVNTLATSFFRRDAPEEPDIVVSLATSLSAFSVCASVGTAAGVAFALPGWPAWLLGSAAFTLAYVLGIGVETALAAHRHPRGGSVPDEPTRAGRRAGADPRADP